MNILLLLTDQQSNRALSCTGNPYLHTPHMAALANSGVRFEQGYCAAPVCGPSRACVATGRMPHENGVLVNSMSIPEQMPTMGEVFGDAGYQTAWTGRWCVPGNGPEIRGFDCLHDPSQPLGQGMFADSHVADCAIDFLGQKHERPFLLGVSLCNPHDICYWVMQQSTPQGKLDAEAIGLKEMADSLPFNFLTAGDLPPLPANFAIDPDEPEFIGKCRVRRYYGQECTFTWDWDEQTWRRYLYAYYRLTEMVDVQVGRVMAALGAAGLEEDTLVVLTSDHGEGMAAHRWVVKLGLYEEPAYGRWSRIRLRPVGKLWFVKCIPTRKIWPCRRVWFAASITNTLSFPRVNHRSSSSIWLRIPARRKILLERRLLVLCLSNTAGCSSNGVGRPQTILPGPLNQVEKIEKRLLADE